MDISYEGIGQTCITMRRGGAISVGNACSVSANNTAAVSADEKTIVGVAAAVRGDFVSVIVRGAVTVPYTGTAPAAGFCPLSGNGSGGVKYLEGGTYYHVLNVNTSAMTVTFIL